MQKIEEGEGGEKRAMKGARGLWCKSSGGHTAAVHMRSSPSYAYFCAHMGLRLRWMLRVCCSTAVSESPTLIRTDLSGR